ncbi:MAG: hypothetical protein ACR2IE_00630 [Candidatus Sumerlaeaceae bacterium]
MFMLMSAPPICAAYPDGRPEAKNRMDAKDHGVVLRHGTAPQQCDYLGARDIWVWQHGDTVFMHYDAAGPKGWLCALATSSDLTSWTTHGPVLELGPPGSDDSKSASYGTTYLENGTWHMFYLGTPNVTPPPDLVPSFPYLTLKAQSKSPYGPWTKQRDVVPFRPIPGTYTESTASPGHIIKQGNEYLQFFSASRLDNGLCRRTLGIARTHDLNTSWTMDKEPIVPLTEQIENSSLYYEASISTWFLFTNHIGIDANGAEYTDAVWVYWSKELGHWSVDNKAVVLDGHNCTWSRKCIGLPSVLPWKGRLAIFYDAPGGDSINHMKRDVGLAWLDLPLRVP